MINNNNRRRRRSILTILTLLWMLFIFSMSAAEKDESNQQSGKVVDAICSVVVEGYKEMPDSQKLEVKKKFTHPVRKCAHMSEYTILGVLLSLTAFEYFMLEETISSNSKRKQEAGALQDWESAAAASSNSKSKQEAGASGDRGPAAAEAFEKTIEKNDRKNGLRNDPKAAAVASREKFVRIRKAFPTALFLGFLYACSDEYHQTFVSGRSGELKDVMIDTTGVLIGAVIIAFIIPAMKQWRNKKF